MKAFLFPGQGSQFVGMGAKLFDEVEEFREMEDAVDDVLGYSVRELCLKDSAKQLSSTQFTQPALYVVNALHYYKALSLGQRPTAVAGHSLGEYNALFAAGVFTFLTGLRIVKKRGELMSQVRNGGMAAAIGINADLVLRILRENRFGNLDIANFNSPMQTIISGPAEELTRIAPLLEAAGATACIPLPVSAAFHSRYMESAAASFDQFLQGLTFAAPRIPVISNVTARPYEIGTPGHSVRDLLTRQIASPVQWVETIRYLRKEGFSEFVEIGPGNVLVRLLGQMAEA